MSHATATTMGNLCSCFSPKSVRQKRKSKASKRLPNSSSTAAGALPTGSSNRWTRMRSSRKEKVQDALIQEQAMAAAILFQQHQRNVGPLPFDRSTSLRFPTSGSKKNSLPRSSSSRARSLTDPLLQPQQLVNQVWFVFFPPLFLAFLEILIVEFDISLRIARGFFFWVVGYGAIESKWNFFRLVILEMVGCVIFLLDCFAWPVYPTPWIF